MKKLFLCSSVDVVAKDIARHLEIRKNATVAYVVTASEAETGDMSWREDNRKALQAVGFQLTDYTFTDKSGEQIENDLKQFDVLCIEGGNTFYLLEQIQRSGCEEVIRELVRSGMPYIGSSAGSIVTGPNIYPLRHLDEYDFSRLDGFEGLGLVDFVILPHWGSDFFKKLYLNKRLEYAYNVDYKYMLLTDNQYVYVEDEAMKFIDVLQSQ